MSFNQPTLRMTGHPHFLAGFLSQLFRIPNKHSDEKVDSTEPVAPANYSSRETETDREAGAEALQEVQSEAVAGVKRTIEDEGVADDPNCTNPVSIRETTERDDLEMEVALPEGNDGLVFQENNSNRAPLQTEAGVLIRRFSIFMDADSNYRAKEDGKEEAHRTTGILDAIRFVRKETGGCITILTFYGTEGNLLMNEALV